MISRNGMPVVGFGASESDEKKFYGTMLGVPLGGLILGTAGGTLLGHRTKSGILTAVGAIAGGLVGGAGGIMLANRLLGRTSSGPQTTNSMVPGQVWTAVGAVHPIKAWTDVSKRAVEDAVVLALGKLGLNVNDGYWSDVGYNFTALLQPSRATTLANGATLHLASEWADQVTFSNVARAPANPKPLGEK